MLVVAQLCFQFTVREPGAQSVENSRAQSPNSGWVSSRLGDECRASPGGHYTSRPGEEEPDARHYGAGIGRLNERGTLQGLELVDAPFAPPNRLRSPGGW